MSTIDNFNHVSNCAQYKPRGSLLEKYKIPIQHLDFEYVKGCNDANKLEKMIEILTSGEEGHYPELLKTTEDQLRAVRPNSKALRQSAPVLGKSDLQKDEVNQLSSDLTQWITQISKNNKELTDRKVSKPKVNVEIRKNAIITEEHSKREKKEEKIKSTDYEAWNKYDPDTELMKMELEEEKKKKSITTAKSSKPTIKKSVTFNKFSTEAEAYFISDRELEKGKEFFKSGDYEDALHYFNNSISSKPTAKNYNNRALTHIKLKQFSSALKDTEKVLAIEPSNIKALLRKAQALDGLKKYEEALEIVDAVIEIDPNHIYAQELANRVRPFCKSILKNTKLKIVEIE